MLRLMSMVVKIEVVVLRILKMNSVVRVMSSRLSKSGNMVKMSVVG